jgi:hypothetical protein
VKYTFDEVRRVFEAIRGSGGFVSIPAFEGGWTDVSAEEFAEYAADPTGYWIRRVGVAAYARNEAWRDADSHQCLGVTKAGRPCRNAADWRAKWPLCRIHQDQQPIVARLYLASVEHNT